ncbi:oxygen-independent coproporphyrinogen III oxidase [Rhodovibrio salinarum]|uniref:Coproporphyrinogen-III oxidase n=1 Tax=Rhodovibrio salinarum TaxID=1087 RepID=A0A934QIF9_9PROT|nr:oxygen-independent coproporphyrinogen III oxidase [Rhodovibrio salinarum]MBK1697581.1 oxygen-independent coproporphyrinogen III oxidase [Rhodovibrio salinarum]
MSTITDVPTPAATVAPTDNVQLATTELLEKYDGRVPRYTSYPTAPHFSDRVTPGVYAHWLRDLPEGAPLSLYLHVPFCDSLCWFCGCNTTVVNRPEPVARYVDLLLQEIDMVARTIGDRRAVSQIHLGGGSPTILNAEQVHRVFTRLRHNFDLRSDAEVAVEIDPRGLSEEVIAAFAEAGLSRASIGVQDINPKVQDAINRIQSHETTTRCVELLRKHGVNKLNLDLMYGLPYQGIDDLHETVRQNLELSPDRVAVFGYAHVPWMKKHQKLIPEDALPGTEERWQQYREAAGWLVGAGYWPIGLDHFAKPTDSMAQALREGWLHRNFQGYTTDQAPALLGLGASAIGKTPQGYTQNHRDVPNYAAAIKDSQLPTVKGVAIGTDDAMRSDAIEQVMCFMTVDVGEVAERHGADPSVFDNAIEQLREMEQDGLLRITGGRVTVLESGRPLLRTVSSVFDAYLESTQQRRHASAV